MDKRAFLRGVLAASAMGLTGTRLWAAPTGGSGARFILVFLRGAYDSLSAVVPYADSFYYESRPGIAIAPPDVANPQAALRLDARWGLHPALADTALPMYQAGQLAFVPFAGTEFVSRSHFQAQDWLETGKLPQQRPDPGSGFLNRLLQQLHGRQGGVDANAVSFTAGLPIVLRGERPVANTPLARTGGAINASYEAVLSQMYAGHALQPLVDEGLGLQREVARMRAGEMDAAARGALAPSGFAAEAGRIARIMRDHPAYTIAFVDLGGWDTHAAQGGAQGVLANRLSGLGQGISVLGRELGPLWPKTVVVVLSEFGRTFRENGSLGTDHGHGSTFWIAGGSVRGGRVAGEQLPLTADKLHEGRDVPVANEYRGLLASLYRQMYGLDARGLDAVFPGARPRPLALV